MRFFQITAAVLPGLTAAGKFKILEAHNAAVSVNKTAVITVFGSDKIDYCEFRSSLGTTMIESRTVAYPLSTTQPMPDSHISSLLRKEGSLWWG